MKLQRQNIISKMHFICQTKLMKALLNMLKTAFTITALQTFIFLPPTLTIHLTD